MKTSFFTICFLLLAFNAISQKVSETNTDEMYRTALNEYQERNYQRSLELTTRGLQIAPEYHDIRILQIRNLWALENYDVPIEKIAINGD